MAETIDDDRRRVLGATVMSVVGVRLGMLGSVLQQVAPVADPLPVSGELQSLGRATGWLNTQPLTPTGLGGRVVLVGFWTYTCINWLRQLPYVRAWAERYKASGLVVIGVHTPEFTFEHNVDNVRRAAKDIGVEYPVAIDNDYAIWRGFRNSYWPALYLLDAKGKVRYRHFGEGEYGQSETMIQRALAESGARDVGRGVVSVEGRGIEAAPDWESLRSPETYLGSERTRNFASSQGVATDGRHVYRAPSFLKLNYWALYGDWTLGREATVLNRANGRVGHRFHARDLHMVMGPPARGTPVRFRVFIDGQPPGAAHGIDVDEQGNGTAVEQRMYQLIRQPKPITDRQFEIEFVDPGVEIFSFTFG